MDLLGTVLLAETHHVAWGSWFLMPGKWCFFWSAQWFGLFFVQKLHVTARGKAHVQ